MPWTSFKCFLFYDMLHAFLNTFRSRFGYFSNKFSDYFHHFVYPFCLICTETDTDYKLFTLCNIVNSLIDQYSRFQLHLSTNSHFKFNNMDIMYLRFQLNHFIDKQFQFLKFYFIQAVCFTYSCL
jgi:hypothetical protein